MKSALVTGITGQDGAYLSELLLAKNYTVFGTYRGAATRDFWRIDELGIRHHTKLRLIPFEAISHEACIKMLELSRADEVYNLGGQSSATASLLEPLPTAHANGMTAQYWLEAIRLASPSTRYFQAGSSELFGEATQVPQTESTPFYPTSPYGFAKLFAHWATVNYREAFGIFGTNGILFNHESPLRGLEFVTRKITNAFARMRLGQQDCLELGNMDSKRDWGYAKDYVLGMWTALQAREPDNYIFATNKMHTVRDFVTLSGNSAGFDLVWKGTAANEVGIDRQSGKILVRINPSFYRPLEIHQRVGNPGKAFEKLHWIATTSLAELCAMMVAADVQRNQRCLVD